MAKKDNKIRLESSLGTGCAYTTIKNSKNTPAKLVLKKYDWIARKNADFLEKKIK